MNHFRLFAHGESFDVDAYVARSPIQFDGVWRRGEQRKYACIESLHPTSGIEKYVGDGSQIPFLDQDQMAIDFLASQTEALRELGEYPGVDTFSLGLQYQTELRGGTIGFSLGPSAELMWHALNVGIDLRYFVVLDRRQEGVPWGFVSGVRTPK